MKAAAFLLAALLSPRYEPARIAIDGVPVTCSSVKLCEKCGVALGYRATYHLSVWGGDPAEDYIWVLPDGTKQEGRTADWSAGHPGCLTLWTRAGIAAQAHVAIYTWGGR